MVASSIPPPAGSLCYVLEQDTICCLVLVQPKKTCPDMTEKLLTGSLRIKTNTKQLITYLFCDMVSY